MWFTGHEGAVLSIAWSNSGKFVLSGSADHTGRLWAVDGDMETQVRADSEAIRWPHFTHIRASMASNAAIGRSACTGCTRRGLVGG